MNRGVYEDVRDCTLTSIHLCQRDGPSVKVVFRNMKNVLDDLFKFVHRDQSCQVLQVDTKNKNSQLPLKYL